MDIVRLCIPYAFIRERLRMSWREVLFGLEEELIDPAAPTQLAAEQLANSEHSETLLVELAGVDHGADARLYVDKLAAREDVQSVQEIKAKWLCVVLAWIFEHKEEYADPLRAVEEVYADFGYPERIAGFVRYMPSDEPDLGSRELNEARLYSKWQSYLRECSNKYGTDSRTNTGGTDPR